MAGTLAALVLGLGLAAAQAKVPVDITPAESAAMDAEHRRLGAEAAAALDAVEAHRLAYKGAADPDALLAEWAKLLGPVRALMRRQMNVWEHHRSRHNALEIIRVARAFKRAETEKNAQITYTPELQAVHETNIAMAARQQKLIDRYAKENDAFVDAAQARNLARARDADLALAGRVGLAAGAAAVLFALWSYWRPPTVVTLPAAPALPPAGAGAVPPLVGGNISVVRPIGRGGMGEVYEGFDKTLQRRVALKRLRPELVGSANDLSRLLNEARLVAALKHPNIVAIHSVEKEAGQVFLVFEYVDGPTLTTLISQRRQLRWPEALAIFQGVCAALAAAHARNIVHRDLKPGNIMLDSKGVAKVMDFGLAHEAARVVSRLTSSGGWGTPPYMSPEQELGEVNAGVDLFALNVCLYEMLTGELPFTGPNFLAQKRERVYLPVSQAVPALPKALDAFFALAFDPDPAKRFPDAAALSAAARAVS